MPDASAALGPWSNFYVMIGSSAAALTGLMFVVITLVTGGERTGATRDGIATFSTPTVVHFGAALLTAAVLLAPWHVLFHPALVLGVMGLAGVAYGVLLTIRARRLETYRPDLEDWIWHAILPFTAYGSAFAGALLLPAFATEALYAVAAAAALLIFIGIHNAWDIVTYLAVNDDEPADSRPPN